jgi:hypothetical protein
VPSSGQKAQRTCLACRKVSDQDQLVRYVLSPQGEVLVDYRRRLPGRGAYTCIDRTCILTAVKRQQFDRVFRGKATISGGGAALVEAVGQRVRERALNLLGMARKSGNVIAGSSLVLAALAEPAEVALVILAEDVSPAIADKVSGKAAVVGVPWFVLGDKETLGQLLGKGERSVIAFRKGSLAESAGRELSRYEQLKLGVGNG